jgi:DUF2997 family protein
MSQIMEIIISPSGETRLETKGFAGAACQRASQFLEKALGMTQSEQLTAEFYAPAINQHRLREGQP